LLSTVATFWRCRVRRRLWARRGGGRVRRRLGGAGSRLDRDHAIGCGRGRSLVLRGELIGGLGLGRKLLLQDLQLRLLGGEARTLIGLQLGDLIVQRLNLRRRLCRLVGDGRRRCRLEEELAGKR